MVHLQAPRGLFYYSLAPAFEDATVTMVWYILTDGVLISSKVLGVSSHDLWLGMAVRMFARLDVIICVVPCLPE